MHRTPSFPSGKRGIHNNGISEIVTKGPILTINKNHVIYEKQVFVMSLNPYIDANLAFDVLLAY